MDLRVTVDGKVYEIDIEETLADLTGEESTEVEDYLGGWDKYDGVSARSLILHYWLALRGNGEKITLREATQEKGIVFGDRVKFEEIEDDDSPPALAPDEAGAIPSTPSAVSEDSGAGTWLTDTA